MTDVTNTELIVTAHVRDNYTGVAYETYVHDGATYWTFATDPFVRWVDTDSDGWWDYGTRDEGFGHWSTFDGFVWRDSRGRVIDEAPDGSSSLPNNVSQVDQHQDVSVDTATNDWFF